MEMEIGASEAYASTREDLTKKFEAAWARVEAARARVEAARTAVAADPDRRRSILEWAQSPSPAEMALTQARIALDEAQAALIRADTASYRHQIGGEDLD